MKRISTLLLFSVFSLLSLLAAIDDIKTEKRFTTVSINNLGSITTEKSADGFDLDSENYLMNFEEDEDVSAWGYMNFNQDERYWSIYTDEGIDSTRCAAYLYSSTMAADDWITSPAFYLKKGESYTISFYYKAGMSAFPEKLAFYYGTDNTQALTTLVDDFGEVSNTNYQKATYTINVEADNDYYFGWYCYSIADQYILCIDSVSIRKNSSDQPSEGLVAYYEFDGNYNNSVDNSPVSIENEMSTAVLIDGELNLQFGGTESAIRFNLSTQNYQTLTIESEGIYTAPDDHTLSGITLQEDNHRLRVSHNRYYYSGNNASNQYTNRNTVHLLNEELTDGTVTQFTESAEKLATDFTNRIKEVLVVDFTTKSTTYTRTWLDDNTSETITLDQLCFEQNAETSITFSVWDWDNDATLNLDYVKIYASGTSGGNSGSTNQEQENNDSFSTANTLQLFDTIYANISDRNDVDCYKVTLPQDGALTLIVNPESSLNSDIGLYDCDSSTFLGSCTSCGGYGDNDTLYRDNLMAGTYFIEVVKAFSYSSDEESGAYILYSDFEAANYENDPELNDYFINAVSVDINDTITGHIGYYKNNYHDEYDCYKITLPNDGALTLIVDPDDSFNSTIHLYQEDTTQHITGCTTCGSYGEADTLYIEDLTAGTYYFYVANEFSYASGIDCGSYRLTTQYKGSSSASDALSLPFEDNFETNQYFPDLYTQIDVDNDGYSFKTSSVLTLEGQHSCMVYTGGEAGENWLILPKLSLPEGHTILMSFLAKSEYDSYSESFEMYASTSGTEKTDFSQISTNFTAPKNKKQYDFELTDYAGQECYIAIRHFTEKGWRFWIDDIKVKAYENSLIESQGTNHILISPNPADHYIEIHNLDNLQSATIYSLNGKCIYTCKDPLQLSQPINIREIESGLYIIKINAGGKVFMEKLSIK